LKQGLDSVAFNRLVRIVDVDLNDNYMYEFNVTNVKQSHYQHIGNAADLDSNCVLAVAAGENAIGFGLLVVDYRVRREQLNFQHIIR
jgi:NADH:ubiquinone oxidoreductase subunit K